jgi:hypothetical protein
MDDFGGPQVWGSRIISPAFWRLGTHVPWILGEGSNERGLMTLEDTLSYEMKRPPYTLRKDSMLGGTPVTWRSGLMWSGSLLAVYPCTRSVVVLVLWGSWLRNVWKRYKNDTLHPLGVTSRSLFYGLLKTFALFIVVPLTRRRLGAKNQVSS